MDLRGKRIEEGYTNLVTVEGDSVASSGKLQNGQGTDLGNIAVGGLSFNSGDGELQLPAGTTAERPASPSAGYARFNTDKGKVEIYTGAAWLSIALEGAVQLEAATATVTGQDAVAQINTFISQFGTPASAFSVRKLGDTDVCMRVRRSSDNAEQNIGFDGQDLDETALTTFVGANDGFVTTWYDQSVDNSTLPAEHGSGATASYSLRLVDSSYTGDAIRVRRSSDNAEQDIGFVDGELDTSSLETFCSGTNGFVTTWYDQSGSNDATQATAGSQPQIVSSGSTILENGKPALDFDGSDDGLDIATSIPFTDHSLHYVFKTDNTITTSSSVQATFSGDGTSEMIYTFGSVTGGLTNERQSFLSATGAAVDGYGQTSFDISGQKIDSLLYQSGGNMFFFQNGSSISLSTHSSGGFDVSVEPDNVKHIGYRGSDDSFYLDGKFQEIIIFDSDTSANRESIELNQASYYDIGVSIGATQATAGSQPKIVSSGSVIKENSVPALDFDGGDDFLNAGKLGGGTKFSNYSVIHVTTTQDVANSGAFFGGANSTGNNDSLHLLTLNRNTRQGKYEVLFTDGTNLTQAHTTNVVFSENTQFIAGQYYDSGNTIDVFVDGNSESMTYISQGASSVGGTEFDFAIGRAGEFDGQYLDGTHQEIIIYDSDKSSDRTDIESNIATYYNITI